MCVLRNLLHLTVFVSGFTRLIYSNLFIKRSCKYDIFTIKFTRFEKSFLLRQQKRKNFYRNSIWRLSLSVKHSVNILRVLMADAYSTENSTGINDFKRSSVNCHWKCFWKNNRDKTKFPHKTFDYFDYSHKTRSSSR